MTDDVKVAGKLKGGYSQGNSFPEGMSEAERDCLFHCGEKKKPLSRGALGRKKRRPPAASPAKGLRKIITKAATWAKI